MRLAWFSPMPPVPSGIATCSAEVVRELGRSHTIDVFVHAGRSLPQIEPGHPGIFSAHDFIWRHRADPYDLTVFQIGNSSHHDYIWPYLFRYPGLTVLHDVRVHHARAAALLRTNRRRDFRREFIANHPQESPDLAELAVAGFDNHLYYSWPFSRLIIEASRLTAVHSSPLAADLAREHRGAHITHIRLAHGELLTTDRIAAARARVRRAHRISEDAVLFGVFGGITPDKRIPQILDALSATIPYASSVHLLLAGAAARHYDVAADVRQRGLEDRVTLTGYLTTDAELTECIAACDVSLNLRWPTAREMSGPWLRALAAARPTVAVDLAHLVDVPSIDPRTWRVNPIAGMRGAGSGVRFQDVVTQPIGGGAKPRNADPDLSAALPDPGSRTTASDPVTVAIDILDEDHSLRLAMRRLATDPELRSSLGAAGQRYWQREHAMPRMVEDYERVLAQAAALPVPRVALPSHLVNNGDARLQEILTECGVPSVWS
jgi:glycosyltransferase involved in cell wall biosynthesis